MSTLTEVASILRENGDDQLEVQLELTTIAENILASINAFIEGVSSAAMGSVSISAGDMIQNEIIEGVGDALTTSREEEALDRSASILTEMLKSINFLQEDIQSVYDILDERLESPDRLGDLEDLEAEREAAAAGQTPASGGGPSGPSGGIFGGIIKVVKKIGKFFSMVGIAIAAAIGAVFAFGDDNQIEKMIETLKNVFTTIIDALTPAFNFIKDEIIPVLIDLIPPVLEAIGFLFDKVIGPIITDVILPIVKVALDGLLAFFNFVSDAINNPREVAAEVMFKIVDFFKDIGDFFGDMTDKVMIALGNTINSVLEGLAGFVEDIPIVGESAAESLRGMKTDISEEAEKRIEERADASRERDAESERLTQERIARREARQAPAAPTAEPLPENYEEQQKLAERQLDVMEGDAPADQVFAQSLDTAQTGEFLTPEQMQELKERTISETQTRVETAVPEITQTRVATAVPEVRVDVPTPAISVPVPAPVVQAAPAAESIPPAITIPEGVRVTPFGSYASYNKFTNTQAQFDTVEEAVKFKDASIEEAATMDSYAAEIYEKRKQLDEQMQANFAELEAELAAETSASVVPVATREQQSGQMAQATDQNTEMKAEQSSASANIVSAPTSNTTNNVSNTQQIISSPMPAAKNNDDGYGGLIGTR